MSRKLPKIGILTLITALAMAPMGRVAEQAVAHRTFATDEYQSFIRNWDEKAVPVLCALIRSSAEWESVFHPAAFGFGTAKQKKPFAPEAKSFESEQLLVVARVMDAPTGEVFKIEKLSTDGDVLTLRYTFTKPPAASYTVKQFLGLRIPKHDYAKVVVIENGQQVGAFDLKGGHWSAPAFPKDGKP
jgi:hypothetical protein